MPNVMATATNFQMRINNYVPAMRYASDVNYNGVTRVSFGAPPAANATYFATGVSIAVAGTTSLASALIAPAIYGQNVVIVASGPSTATVTIAGWDYLGQPMSEALTAAGTTPVLGNKAFKVLNAVTYTATAGTTINIGTGTKLGLPYRAIRAQYEVVNGVSLATGTFVAAIGTDPQTATTGDPRGTYVPATTLDGVTVITAAFDMINDVNAANRGGLHGIPQFAS